MQCPNCGFNSPPEMRFCGRCGTRLKQICPECSFANPLDYRFCGNCGRPLAAVQPGEGQWEPGTSDVPPLRPVSREEPSTTDRPEEPPEGLEPAGNLNNRFLEGDRRTVSVIVTDVSGSTNLLARIGTERWVELMNRTLQILEAQVYRFGGEVDQFRGDGLVAFFGARAAHEDDPERAVLAALAMQKAMRAHAAELAEQAVDLQLRIGVNTGEVIVTRIGGHEQHRVETAMGEAVALAARMETAAEPGTVLVSENSYNLIAPLFEWESLGEIMVKGLDEPVAVYRPLAHRGDTRQPYRLDSYGLSPVLVGRETELATLKARVEDLAHGRGGIASVIGEKGIGKLRLVTTVRQDILRDTALRSEAGEPSPLASLTWLEGVSRSFDQSLPYSIWLALLQDWLGSHTDEPRQGVRHQLQRSAERLWDDQASEYIPYLATLLNLPLEDKEVERVIHLDAEGLRRHIFMAIRGWIQAMTQQGPLVLVFRDLNWADTTSLNLLEYCLPLSDRELLLFIFVLRPDRASATWAFQHWIETEYLHRLTTLTLGPLTEAESGKVIDGLIGSQTLPPETRALILSKAEGNPYYIEELLYSLIEQGVLIQDSESGRWRATREVGSLKLPDTLQSLLLSRIDSQSPDGRQVLQMAAVIGPVFWSHVLQALHGAPDQLREQLTALQRAQLIYEEGRVPNLGMEYTFNSQLIREVAYNSILNHQRVRYHRLTVEALEGLLGRDISVQYYGLLAYHCRQAEERGKELLYTHLGAQQAHQIYANDEALELYTRALELLSAMEAEASDADELYAVRSERFEILSERHELFYLLGDIEAAAVDAQALLPLARQLSDDPIWLVDALLQQPGVAHWTSREELSAGLKMAEEALALARQLKDPYREMRCLHTLGRQRHFLNYPSWQDADERALALARQLEDRRYEMRILSHMGTAYSWSDQPEQGMKYLQEALPLCRALEDKPAEVHLLSQIGLQAERQGDYYRLLTEYQETSLQISRDIGYREGENTSLVWCGQTRAIYLGDLEGGRALVETGREGWRGWPREVFALLRLVQIMVQQDEHQAALALLERGRQIREQDIGDMPRAGFRLVAAILYNAIKEEPYLQLALQMAVEARRLVANSPFITRQYEMAAASQSVQAHLSLAGLATNPDEQQQHREQALQISATGLALFRAAGFVQIVECTSEEILFRHSQALAANNHADSAHYLQQAHDEMMRKFNLIPPESRFRETYLENITLHREIRTAFARQQAATQQS